MIVVRITAAAVCALALGGAVTAAAQAAERTYYVDCARGRDSATGRTPATAWRSLAKASRASYRPGDAIRLKRGVRCVGVFAPASSGTTRAPIVAGAYGSGSSRPVLDGGGARAAVVLKDVQGWTIRDLAIRNPGSVATVGVLRSAIQITNSRLGVASGFTILENAISDVATSKLAPPGTAKPVNYGKDSGGIQLQASGKNAFAGVRIEGNTLDRVGREGIFVNGGAPTRGLVVRGNRLHAIQGDGIVAVRAAGGRIERNVLDGFNTRGTVSNAGMWAYQSSDLVFAENEVSHGANGNLDGTAYDIDGGNRRLTFEYNLSHDNAGGFLIVCGDPGVPSGGSVVRYNVSQDDAISGLGLIRAPCGPVQDVRIYNNTIYASKPGVGHLLLNLSASSLAFTNNLFVGPKGGALIDDQTSTYDGNLYTQVTCKLAHPDPRAVVVDPRFVRPGRAVSRATADGYRLRVGSPALRAGRVVSGNGGRDFFGNPVTASGRPNIGAYEGPGVEPEAGDGAGADAPGCGAT